MFTFLVIYIIFNKLNFEIQGQIVRFWRLTSKIGEIAFLVMTPYLEKKFVYPFECSTDLFYGVFYELNSFL